MVRILIVILRVFREFCVYVHTLSHTIQFVYYSSLYYVPNYMVFYLFISFFLLSATAGETYRTSNGFKLNASSLRQRLLYAKPGSAVNFWVCYRTFRTASERVRVWESAQDVRERERPKMWERASATELSRFCLPFPEWILKLFFFFLHKLGGHVCACLCLLGFSPQYLLPAAAFAHALLLLLLSTFIFCFLFSAKQLLVRFYLIARDNDHIELWHKQL